MLVSVWKFGELAINASYTTVFSTIAALQSTERCAYVSELLLIATSTRKTAFLSHAVEYGKVPLAYWSCSQELLCTRQFIDSKTSHHVQGVFRHVSSSLCALPIRPGRLAGFAGHGFFSCGFCWSFWRCGVQRPFVLTVSTAVAAWIEVRIYVYWRQCDCDCSESQHEAVALPKRL